MKENELHKGDLVSIGGYICRIFDKYEERACYTIVIGGKECHFFAKYDVIDPVPMTADIARQNGFEKQGNGFVFGKDIVYYPSVSKIVIRDIESTAVSVGDVQEALRSAGYGKLANAFVAEE